MQTYQFQSPPITVAPASAGIVFQTTFDIPTWTQGGGLDPLPVDDLIKHYGDWMSSGQPDQIIALANNPTGGGGLGFRHYRGVGVNSGGGGLRITLPSPLTEMWVRQYMKNVLSYTGGHPNYTKDHYWNVGGNFLIFGYQGGAWGLHTSSGSVNIPSSIKYEATDDGQWHCYEYHVKQNGANGFVEMWIDNVPCLQRTINLGSTPWANFVLGENQSNVSVAGYTEYDDIAVSNVGRIGVN